MCALAALVEGACLLLASAQVEPAAVARAWLPALLAVLVFWDAQAVAACGETLRAFAAAGGIPALAAALALERLRALLPVTTPDHSGHTHCPALSARTTAIAVDCAWGVGSCVFLACMLLRLRLAHQRQPFFLFSSAAFAAHTVTACDPGPFEHWLLRALVYATSALLLFHARARVSGLDRNTHRTLLPHVCAHTLFVHPAVLLASALFFVGVFARVYVTTYTSMHTAGAAPGPQPKHGPSTLSLPHTHTLTLAHTLTHAPAASAPELPPADPEALAELRRAQGRV